MRGATSRPHHTHALAHPRRPHRPHSAGRAPRPLHRPARFDARRHAHVARRRPHARHTRRAIHRRPRRAHSAAAPRAQPCQPGHGRFARRAFGAQPLSRRGCPEHLNALAHRRRRGQASRSDWLAASIRPTHAHHLGGANRQILRPRVGDRAARRRTAVGRRTAHLHTGARSHTHPATQRARHRHALPAGARHQRRRHRRIRYRPGGHRPPCRTRNRTSHTQRAMERLAGCRQHRR